MYNNKIYKNLNVDGYLQKKNKKYKKRVKMALLVSYSVKKVNEGIGVWLHFGYSLNEEAATSFLSRVILRPYRFDSGLRH